MVDKELLREKIRLIHESLKRLEDKRRISLESFKRDSDIQDIVLRNLQVAIQIAIDIGNHIVSDEEWEVPATHAGVFDVLGDHRVCARPLQERLQAMAKFRNLIIHEYHKIDLEKVYSLLQKGLKDIRAFVRAIDERYRL